jgi:hypothetical protein
MRICQTIWLSNIDMEDFPLSNLGYYSDLGIFDAMAGLIAGLFGRGGSRHRPAVCGSSTGRRVLPLAVILLLMLWGWASQAPAPPARSGGWYPPYSAATR